jgi:hypothetical protein
LSQAAAYRTEPCLEIEDGFSPLERPTHYNKTRSKGFAPSSTGGWWGERPREPQLGALSCISWFKIKIIILSLPFSFRFLPVYFAVKILDSFNFGHRRSRLVTFGHLFPGFSTHPDHNSKKSTVFTRIPRWISAKGRKEHKVRADGHQHSTFDREIHQIQELQIIHAKKHSRTSKKRRIEGRKKGGFHHASSSKSRNRTQGTK